jgi:hypothetical protein
LPRLLHRALADDRVERIERLLAESLALQRQRNRLIGAAVALLALALGWALVWSFA